MLRTLLLATALLAAPASAQSLADESARGAIDEPLVRPADYRAVWADEFDRPGLPDPARWRHDTSMNRTGWANAELQYYADRRPENARVEDGKLIITARREPTRQFADSNGQRYTSARLVTQGLAVWRYGFFEVRAKLPCGRGSWPAIWMLGDEDGGPRWPAIGEIDIMEHVGFDEGRVHGTIHSQAFNHVDGTQRGASIQVADVCGSFHDYQLHWTPEAITIGVDGRGFFRFANDGRGDNASWPFSRPHYLILNIAVGGGWGGQQGVDDAAFPYAMEVEHVRVWQAPSPSPAPAPSPSR
jgi:beta-glucanase (GH16 family)